MQSPAMTFSSGWGCSGQAARAASRRLWEAPGRRGRAKTALFGVERRDKNA